MAVPVAGFGRHRASGFLRRHVRRRAAAHVVGLARVLRQQLRDQPEIEDDDAPLGGHQHVGRLDVAMKLASAVQRGHTVDELPECRR